MDQKLIVVIGNQRSGTTVLHKSLAATGYVDEFGEVFHTGKALMRQKSNFFYYREHVRTAEKNELNSGGADCGAYIDYLLGLSNKPYVLIDVKYNSWHHFNNAWQDPFKKPVMMKVLEKRDVLFVHMIRMNLFAQFISMEIARETGRWHYEKKDILDSQEIKIAPNPWRALDFMQSSKSNTLLFRKFLNKSIMRTVELVYERTYDETGFSRYALAKLEEHLGPQIVEKIEVPLLKTPVDMKNAVTNKSELLDFFIGREYEELVVMSLC